jgi:hypothetical protein
MKYIPPLKLKIIMMAFLGTGIWGIVIGLVYEFFIIVVLGAINFLLGGIVGFLYLNQKPKKEKD